MPCRLSALTIYARFLPLIRPNACHTLLARQSEAGFQRRPHSSKPPENLSSPGNEALNVGHSHFLSRASPGAKWKKGGLDALNSEDEPSVDELEGVSNGRGKLLPTSSHLFKLILPLGELSRPGSVYTRPDKSDYHGNRASGSPPTVFLLHPAQPLSHVGRLIQVSLVPALPVVSFRSKSVKGQAFQWSDSTDIGDFIRDAARSAQFFVCLTYEPSDNLRENALDQDSGKTVATNKGGGTKDAKHGDPIETIIQVQVPTFADRTRYLRRRLKTIEDQIAGMETLKLHCEREAHRGARRMAVTGFGMLVVYWAAVARLTFWDYGWEVMEPVTYLSGLSTVILGYLWFLYQGREVSYSSVLAQSVSKRRDTLYKSNGFDIERWADLIGERRSLRKEIGRIAEDYEESEAKEYKEDVRNEMKGEDGRESDDNAAKDENIGKRVAGKVDRGN